MEKTLYFNVTTSLMFGKKHFDEICDIFVLSFTLKTYLLHIKPWNSMNEIQLCVVVFFHGHPAWAMCAVKCTDTHPSVQDATRWKHRRLNLIIQVSWESADVPKRLKFTSNKKPRTQATCCFSNKTTATHCRSHSYSSEALCTSQGNISIDPDKASPARHP